MKKEDKIITNTFWYYADEYRKRVTNEEEIENIDFTEKFFKELFTIIDSGELINMNINAPPTSGKSITGMAIANKVMKHRFKRKLKITDIDRDQQEFSKIMRDPDIKSTIRVIDEWNELEQTGENSSVEQALFDYFSDVMAQRFVHKISCSPTATTDKNALIYLEVISSDKKKMVNYCRLYYKMFNGGIEYKQLIGSVKIDVSDILKEKWYQEYRRRKFEKMDLILKEGIFRPRVLEYAKIILDVTEKLKVLTRMSSIVNANIIRNYIKMEFKRMKIPQSIVGEELATREVSGILDLYKGYWKIGKDIERSHNLLIKVKEDSRLVVEYNNKIISLEEMRKEIKNAINIQEEELRRYNDIKEKYDTVRK